MILNSIQVMMELRFQFLSIGGVGVISVASHVIGNEMQEMVQEVFKWGYLRSSKAPSKIFANYG